MDYALAKELKDAGFPHDWYGDESFSPSLEELIEACGPGAFVLHTNGRGIWIASHSKGKTNEDDKSGRSPTDAVARLWLALNKK